MSADLTLISAATVACLKDGSVLTVRSPYIVTPSAAELAAKKNIRIENVTDAEVNTESSPKVTGSLARFIDSTLLATDTVPEQITTLCEDAAKHGFAAVCIHPIFVAQAVTCLSGTGVAACTICGFPLGTSAPSTKAAEARLAVDQGACEIDMVIPVGLLRAGDLRAVNADISAVRQVLDSDITLKVIIEAPLLTNEEKVAAAIIAVEAGADFVKTGTGLAGPVTVADVRLIRKTVGDRARIKAAGGIRDRQTAEAMIAAGAARIGTSSAVAVVEDPQINV